MSEFDKIVNKARSKINPDYSMKTSNPVEYILLVDGYGQESWPTSFKFIPKAGDFIASKNGRRLLISSITHTFNGVVIELSRNLGGSSGMEGAGSNANPFK